MEKREFLIAKNGEKTCKIGSSFLHSSYNPSAEAERFVATIHCDFVPAFILIAEPCISYCAPYLRRRFPESRIIAIRYCEEFSEYNALFDGAAFVSPKNIFHFESQILALTGEYGLCSSLFLSWKPACSIFKEQDSLAWESIKRLAIKSRALLFTKERFSKRWLANSVNFVKYANNISTIKKTDLPVVIAASGPSLKSALPHLKKLRETYFLICVSSATGVLLRDNIQPDFIISTDGGYWANEHLFSILKTNDVPLAISAESACPKRILQKNPIIPLFYEDGFENEILKIWAGKNGVNIIRTARNGTVSGTAVELALSFTTKAVFACGLDLSPAREYQHTQPNALEKNAAILDNKTRSLETRQIQSMVGSVESLEIYKNWFSENSSRFENRFFRLSNAFPYKNTLGNIRDVDFSFFARYLTDCKKENSIYGTKPPIHRIEPSNRKSALNEIKSFLHKKGRNTDWQEYVFPCDYLLYKKRIDKEEKRILHNEIVKNNEIFIQKLTKMCEHFDGWDDGDF